MSDELKVTKAAVLEAASKCSTAKATLQVLFPDAFKPSDEPFYFGTGYRITTGGLDVNPFCVGLSGAPEGLDGRCLMMAHNNWEMRVEKTNMHTILTFHRKP